MLTDSALPLPRIAPIPREKDEWVLLEEYTLWLPSGRAMILPCGMRSDLASIRPRILWPLIAPFELSALAPLVHDAVYRCQGRLPEEMYEGPFFTRLEADDLFRWIMEMEAVPAWRRVSAYRAVRMFGGKPWREAPGIEVDLPLAETLMSDGELDDLGWGA